MKRICVIFMVCLICLLPVMAFAASPTPDAQSTTDAKQPTQGPSEEPNSISFFSIDNNNVYEGMDKAYKDGYMPTVQNGKAVIVLRRPYFRLAGSTSLPAVPVTPDSPLGGCAIWDHQRQRRRIWIQ